MKDKLKVIVLGAGDPILGFSHARASIVNGELVILSSDALGVSTFEDISTARLIKIASDYHQEVKSLEVSSVTPFDEISTANPFDRKSGGRKGKGKSK